MKVSSHVALRCLACGLVATSAALGPSASAGQPQIAIQYRKAAQAYRDAADKVPADDEERRACLLTYAKHHDCLADQLGPGGPASCPKPAACRTGPPGSSAGSGSSAASTPAASPDTPASALEALIKAIRDARTPSSNPWDWNGVAGKAHGEMYDDHRNGNWSRADANARTVLAWTPGTDREHIEANAFWIMGVAEAAQDRCPTALIRFDEAKKRNFDDVPKFAGIVGHVSLALYAHCLERAGKLDDASHYYSALLRDEPTVKQKERESLRKKWKLAFDPNRAWLEAGGERTAGGKTTWTPPTRPAVITASATAPKPAVDLRPGSWLYNTRSVSGTSILNMTELFEVQEADGGWQITNTSKMNGQPDSIVRAVLDKGALTLRRLSAVGTSDLEISNGQLVGELKLSTGLERIRFDLPGEIFADGAGSHLTIAALPLAEGYSVRFHTLDIQRKGTRPVQLTVVGSEQVSVPAGSFDTFRVDVVSAKSSDNLLEDARTYTLWVAKQSRDVVKIAILLAPHGTATMELVK